MTKNKKLLNSLEAAAYLRISRDTLKSWGNQGIGPKYYEYANGGRRYYIHQLDAWLETCIPEHMCQNKGD